jgi:hypothetical protein
VALNAYLYAYIPMLLRIVTLAAGLKRVIGQAVVPPSQMA